MRYWKHFGTALYPVLGGLGSTPREKKSRRSLDESGRGVREEAFLPREWHVQRGGAVSSSMLGGGLGEVPVDAEGQERPDLKGSMK